MVYMCSCNIKIFNLLDYKKCNILIVGSRNIGPAVAGPAGPVPTPLYDVDNNLVSVSTQ